MPQGVSLFDRVAAESGPPAAAGDLFSRIEAAVAGPRPLGPPNQHTFTAEEFIPDGTATGPLDYAAKLLGGMRDQVVDIGRGLADNVRRSQQNTRAPLTGEAMDFGPGVIDRAKSVAIDTPAAILSAVNTDDPNEAGRRVVDALGYLGGGIGAEENAAVRGATRAAVDATATGARRAVPGVVAVATSPAVKTAATIAADMGTFGALGRVLTQRKIGTLLDQVGELVDAQKPKPPASVSPSPARAAAAARRSANATASQRMVEGMGGASTPLEAMPTVPRPATPSDALRQELMKRLAAEPDWEFTDAVPIDAITRDVTRGGAIIEAGESRPGLSRQLATVAKNIAKNPTPEQLAEVDRIARALRQRDHITAGRR